MPQRAGQGGQNVNGVGHGGDVLKEELCQRIERFEIGIFLKQEKEELFCRTKKSRCCLEVGDLLLRLFY